MTENHNHQTSAPEVPQTGGIQFSKEVEEGRIMAILSYALLLPLVPYFFLPLIIRNNSFSLYHSKQCHVIWLAFMAVASAGGLLSIICIGIPILVVGVIGLIVLTIIGLINAVKGEEKPVPLIGKYGEDWFKGITKV